MGPYRPVRARVGPTRAHEEWENFRKGVFFSNTCWSKFVVFDIQTTFFDGFDMLFSLLAEE